MSAVTTTGGPRLPGIYRRIDDLYSSPLRLTAAAAGWWWVSNLVIGLLISHDFGTATVAGADVKLLFIPVAVNGWHVLVHGVSGVIGLVAATRSSWAAAYLGFFAMAYVGWGAAGLMTDGTLWVFYGDTFGNLVHVVEGAVLGLALTLKTARDQARSTAG